MIRILALLCGLSSIPLPSFALDTRNAQIEMLQRVSEAVNEHANRLGLGQDVITYCRIELSRKTDQFPQNGSIPFSVNYNQIPDQQTLNLVISGRESYEKMFMSLCLSRAKRDLSGHQ